MQLFMKRVFFYIWLSFWLASCVNQPDDLHIALQLAGENRPELEKVLKHYAEDSLKQQAARFLIENMPYHYAYEGETLADYKKFYHAFASSRLSPAEVIDSLNRNGIYFSPASLRIKYDIETVDSAFLVHNIDWAFKVWREQPWGKHVNFQDFCEYILPYRVGNEPLSEWRETLYHQYNSLLDSIRTLPEAKDARAVAQVLINFLTKDGGMKFTGLLPMGPNVGPEIVKWRAGSCREMADVLTYIGRALGIPCGTDYVTLRGIGNEPHSWSFILDKNGNTYMAELPDTLLRKAVDYTSSRAKVWRTTFSLNRAMWKDLKDDKELYVAFRYPLMQDVTPIYADSCLIQLAVSTELLKKDIPNDERIYLCMTNHQEWTPVAFAQYQTADSLYFTDLDGNIVVTLGTWNGNRVQVLSDAFLVDRRDGSLFFYRPEEMETVCLYFKYPLFHEYFLARMKNAVIEGSNHADFAFPDTLYQIPQAPKRLCTTVQLPNKEAYRYIRYRGGQDSYSDIAELTLYGMDNVLLTGKAIGTPVLNDPEHNYMNVFDGNPYTSFTYSEPNGGWAGLDLGKQAVIQKLTYVPRNRDNFIRKGDRYELFYWDNLQWNSLGEQTAMSDSLVYSAPKNALLYLRNHTRGRDERIFEYTRGQTQWFR